MATKNAGRGNSRSSMGAGRGSASRGLYGGFDDGDSSNAEEPVDYLIGLVIVSAALVLAISVCFVMAVKISVMERTADKMDAMYLREKYERRKQQAKCE